ncbi:methyl-accepting chemotaxis protein [Castellaniella caeni]
MFRYVNKQQQATLQQLDAQALQVTVGNASMMSSFTNVVTASREQTVVLQTLLGQVDELAHSVQAVDQSAQDTRTEVQSMHALSAQSHRLVHETSGRIASLGESADGLGQRFEEVRQHAEAIETVLRLIREVAMQTNLLSLNAAVEAVRAGEHGKGFGVVAEEVRKLAAKADDATDRIHRMIAGITSSTQAAGDFLTRVIDDIQTGIRSSQQTEAMLADIHQHSQRTLDAATQMADAAQTQTRLSGDIVHAVDQLSGITQRAIEWVGKSNANIRDIQGVIGDFKHKTMALQPRQRPLDVLLTCAEEMRACNILIKNAESFQQIAPVVTRIRQIDQIIDDTWQRHTARHPGAAGQQVFEQALAAYRTTRARILSAAQHEQFDQVRSLISAQGRPAYERIKAALDMLSNQPSPRSFPLHFPALPRHKASG